MKLCAPPGCRIAIEMQQYTGIGLQGCLMFCRMWRQCHWASVSQPEGRAVARLGPRRQSRAAYVGGTAATDAHCSGGGAEPPPPQTPTWVAVVGSRSLRRRPPPPMTTRTTKRKSCRGNVDSMQSPNANDFKFCTVYLQAH